MDPRSASLDGDTARKTILSTIDKDEILRVYTVGYRGLSLGQGCLTIFLLIIGLTIGVIFGPIVGSLNGSGLANESLIALTDSRLVVLVIKRKVTQGKYRVIDSNFIPLKDIQRQELRDTSEGAMLTIWHNAGRHKFRIKEPSWINRARIIANALPLFDN